MIYNKNAEVLLMLDGIPYLYPSEVKQCYTQTDHYASHCKGAKHICLTNMGAEPLRWFIVCDKHLATLSRLYGKDYPLYSGNS